MFAFAEIICLSEKENYSSGSKKSFGNFETFLHGLKFEQWGIEKRAFVEALKKTTQLKKVQIRLLGDLDFFSWCPANTRDELPKFFCLWKKSQIKTGFTCLLYLALKRIKLIFHALSVSVILSFA